MDDDGGLGIRNWSGYYNHPMKSLGLQLMPNMAGEHDTTKLLLSNGAFLHHHPHHRQCPVPEPPVPMEYVRDGWIHHRDNKILHVLPVNHHNYTTVLAVDNPNPHTFQMLQPHDPSKDDKAPFVDEVGGGGQKDTPSKKRSSQGLQQKAPKPKKLKKAPVPRDESSVGRRRAGRVSAGVVINGIDLDISGLPTPVCSCTGNPQPCYRWGIGGWQSACCTTSMSIHPLPMSTKRRGARIAGRKMSQGAFKKVLEKLAGEGYNLSNPIDLRTYWAKHGTNKFVTIR